MMIQKKMRVVRQYAKQFSWSGNHPVDFKEWEFSRKSEAIKFKRRLQEGMISEAIKNINIEMYERSWES